MTTVGKMQAVLHAAVVAAILEVGMANFKKTSMFMSNNKVSR